MFNITTTKPSVPPAIPMHQLKPCQLARLVNSSTGALIVPETIVMRTANTSEFEIMDLTHPGPDSCWTSENSLKVVPLLPGEQITLTVE